MKKNVLKMMALTFVLSLSLVFTACGSGNNNGADSVNREENTNDAGSTGQENDANGAGSTEQENDANNDANDAGSAEQEENGSGLTALEEYLADPAVQEELSSTIEDEGLKGEVFVEGNVLVFHCTIEESYLEQKGLDLSDDDIKNQLSSAFQEVLEQDLMISVFESIRDEFRNEFDVSDLNVRVVYCGPDGSELASRDY